MHLIQAKAREVFLVCLVLIGISFSDGCEKLTITGPLYQTGILGLYIRSEPDRCGSRTDTWRQQNGNNLIYQLTADSLWYIGPNNCQSYNDLLRSSQTSDSPLDVPVGSWQEKLNDVWSVSQMSVQCYDDISDKECLKKESGDDYVGHAYVTITGKICQPWTSQTTCTVGFADNNITLANNYCRNPMEPSDCHRSRPWCYTGLNMWDYCDIPLCGGQEKNCMKPLGMGNGDIRDDQITSSSRVVRGYEPFQARINASNVRYWKGFSEPEDPLPQLFIDFRRTNRITKLYIQGIDNNFNIKTFNVLYSLDNLTWTGYSDNTDGSLTEFTANSGSDTVPIYFKNPFSARWLVVVPRKRFCLDCSTYIAFRVKIFGCNFMTVSAANTDVTVSIIESNTRWSLANSPYVILQPVTVASGVTLTIEGGVQVVMDGPDAKITFIGCLELESESSLKATFINLTALNTFGSILGNGVNIVFDDKGCSFVNVHDSIFNGVTVEFHTSSSSMNFSNIGIVRSNKALTASGFENKLSTLVVSACNVENNTVGIEWNFSFDTLVLIESSQFIFNDNAVSFTSTRTGTTPVVHVKIDRSSFEGNRNGIASYVNFIQLFLDIVISHSSMQSSNLNFRHDYASTHAQLYFENCTFNISTVYTDIRGNYTINISGSRFLSSVDAFRVSGQPSSITFNDTTVTSVAGTVLEIEATGIVDNIDILSNTFSNNIGQQCISVYLSQPSNAGKITISNSRFINNTLVDVIAIYDEGHGKVEMRNNVFNNPESKRELKIETPWKSGYAIQTSSNWWGSDEREYIISRILDFRSDYKIAEVNISTISLNADLSVTKDTQQWRAWHIENSTVGGTVLEDVVLLSNTDANFTIDSSIYVPRGVKLVIQGSLSMQFKKGRGIIIEGSLEVVTGKYLTVRLEALEGKWGGLWFINSSDFRCRNASLNGAVNGIEAVNTSIDAIGCAIAGDGVITVIGREPVKIVLNNCTLYSNNDNAITVESTNDVTVLISRSIITSHLNAIKISGSYLLNLTLMESEIKSAVYNALTLSGSSSLVANGSLQITECLIGSVYIASNMFKNIEFTHTIFTTRSSERCLSISKNYWETRYADRQIQIEDCTFNGPAKAIFLSSPAQHDTTVIIERNYFNGSVETLHIDMVEPLKLLIKENVFSHSSRKTVEIILNGYTPGWGNDAVVVTNNQFSDNAQDYVIGFSCYNSNYRSTMLLTENHFINNSVTSVVLSTCPGLFVTQNKFENPLSSYDYSVRYTSTEPSYAPRNYWNATTSQEVSFRIYDSQEDSKFVSVEFIPWYTDANLTSLSTDADSSFIRPDGVNIGGTLSHDLTLPLNDQPYVVVEDIIIPFGLTLTIEAGVHLLYSQGGIDVKGRLLAVGFEGSRIVMKPKDDQSIFKGIIFEQPLTNEVRQHAEGWWEMMVEGVWYPVCVYSEGNFPQESADLLCRTAGYEGGAKTFQNFDCSRYVNLADAPAECNRTHIISRVPICQAYHKYLGQCDFYSCGAYQSLLNLTCVDPSSQRSQKTVYKIVTGSELYFSINEENEIKLSADAKYGSELVFSQPCLAEPGDLNCFSISPLLKPGWFLRVSHDKILLEPKINPSNEENFKSESSFYITENKFLQGFAAIESFSQGGYYVAVDSETNTLYLQPLNESNSEFRSSASFKLLVSSSSFRKRRDVTDTLIDSESSTESILRYVDIRSSSTGISLSGKLPQLQFVNIDQSNKNGITLNDYLPGNLTLLGCNISRSAESGIFSKYSIRKAGSSINIVDSVINFNNNHGVSLEISSDVNFLNSSFLDNGGYGVTVNTLLDVTVTVHKCMFVNNPPYSSYTGQLASTSYPGIFSIEECLFTTNGASGAAIYITSSAVVRNCTITGHRRTNWIRSNEAIVHLFSNVKFEGNRLEENRADVILNVHYIKSSTNITITNNLFHNNSAVGDTNSVVLLQGSFPNNFIFSYNIFSNPLFNFEINVLMDRGKMLADMSLNYWDKRNYSAISERIRCFYTDMQYAAVNIYPALLSSQDLTDLLIRPENNENFFQDGTGGEVVTSLIIPYRQEPYIVNRSIFVQGSLTIEDGVILKFQSNTGIYASGTVVIKGTELNPVQAVSFVNQSTWYGIIIDEKLYDSSTRTVDVKHFHVYNTNNGFMVSAKDAQFSYLTLNGTRNTFYASANNISISQSRFLYSGYGISTAQSISNLSVSECTFINNELGINMFYHHSADVRNCQFYGQTRYGMMVQSGYNYSQFYFGPYRVVIANNTFEQIPLAINAIANYYTELEITGNNIRNGSSLNSPDVSGVSVLLNKYSKFAFEANNLFDLPSVGLLVKTSHERVPSDLTTNINDNSFRSIYRTAVRLYHEGYGKVTMRNNSFIANSGQGVSALYFIFEEPQSSQDAGSANILLNRFTENIGSVVVELNDNADSTFTWTNFNPIKFTSNVFSYNQASDAAIYLSYKVVNINYNIFSNPEMQYDLKVGFKNEFQQDSMYNWWGTKDKNEIEGRIFDISDNSSLGLVLYEPFLSQPEFTCTSVSNCSNHGTCVLPDTCECLIGWTGRDCSQYTCTDVNNCLQRGRCVGPNICECNEGWLTPDCSRASCYQKNNCSNRGICTAPNECHCSERYGGDSCSECAQGYWGTFCLACPRCVNGMCDRISGHCVCDGENWAGTLCDKCATDFFGPSCLALINVAGIDPITGPDLGGNEILFHGSNFPDNSTMYRCRFDRDIVSAAYISSHRISCIAPRHDTGNVWADLSIYPDDDFPYKQFIYTYYGVCPVSACGSKSSPPQGVCAYGNCLCNYPWIGADCDIVGLAPVIQQQRSVHLVEGQPLDITLNDTQGNVSPYWSFISYQYGMTISASSGRILWNFPTASLSSYSINVSCSNPYGRAEMSFILVIPPAYTVTLDPVPFGPYINPETVFISGKLIWNNQESINYMADYGYLVNVLVNTTSGMITVPIKSKYPDFFYTRFTPQQNHAGLIQLDARHPSDDGFETRTSWALLGLTLETRFYLLDGYLGEFNYSALITIANPGAHPLTFVKLLKTEIPYQMRIKRNDSNAPACLIHLTTCPIATVLHPGEILFFDVEIDATTAYSGYFGLSLITAERVTRHTSISYRYLMKVPKLELSPYYLQTTVVRGNKYTYSINVTNTGLRAATDVRPELPEESMLSLQSFGTNVTLLGQGMIILNPGESAILVISVAPEPDREIGENTGSINVKSVETYVTLSFSFVVASSDRLNLIVRVEDEYTYFSAGSPMLSGAGVRIVSQFRGGDDRYLVTGISGEVMFENIREDYYSLYTSADRHIGDSKIIFATDGTGNNVTVFLQRTAVTTTFTVTPVTFEDKYEVVLEADFETHVPIPVVTIEPAQLDLDVLYRGLMPVINFKITNHGLIDAKEFQFLVPPNDTNPYMDIEVMKDVGDIPANTTIYVKAAVKLQNPGTDSCIKDVYWMNTMHYYICKDKQWVFKAIYFTGGKKLIGCDPPPVLPPGESGGGSSASAFHGWDTGGQVEKVYKISISVSTPVECDDKTCRSVTDIISAVINCRNLKGCWDAVKTIASCASLLEYLPQGRLVKIAIDVARIGRMAGKVAYNMELAETLFSASKNLRSGDEWGAVKDLGKWLVGQKMAFIGTISDCLGIYDAVKNCMEALNRCFSDCTNAARRKRSIGLLTRAELAPVLARRARAVNTYMRLAVEFISDTAWFSSNGTKIWCIYEVQPAMDDTSEGGPGITRNEINHILSKPLPDGVTKDMAEALLMRLNNTQNAWNSGVVTGDNVINARTVIGIIDEMENYTEEAYEAGYESISDWYLNGYNEFMQADEKPNEGVCAKVRIQILQKLVLTRSAFNARLVIDNGEMMELKNIRVDIFIRTYLGKDSARQKFAVGNATLTGLTDVSGSGSLAVRSKGTAEWLIIPYSTAAPYQDVLYDIGGTLYYTINGENMTIPLFPDTVTVKPDPQLYINYFLEKFVYSDDPLTTDIVEPVMPFSLGILISNDGYGSARNLEITSAQPQIIDNEKGLFVNFLITGAQLGNNSVLPSLTVNFGDIEPHSTKMARWIMASNLSGIFSNYSATFKNINPLGDPELSVVESVKIHELLHVVRVDTPADDGVLDFLVVDPNKLDVWPSLIYQSQDGLNPLNVRIGNVTSVTASSDSIQVVVNTTLTGWIYFRSDFQPVGHLITVSNCLRTDGRHVIAEQNVWISKVRKNTYVHILDYIPDAQNPTPGTVYKYSYQISLTRSASDAPKFANTTYFTSVLEEANTMQANILEEAQTDDLVTVTVSHDNLNRSINYKLLDSDNDNLPFTIDSMSGRLSLKKSLNRQDQQSYSVVVLAVDDSTPPLTGTAVVVVQVTDINDNNPVFDQVDDMVSIGVESPVGFAITVLHVTDKDDGDNGHVDLTLEDSSGLFDLNNMTLITKESLTGKSDTYTVKAKATDRGVPPRETDKIIMVKVRETNVHAPVFSEIFYDVNVLETDNVAVSIFQVIVSDADFGDNIRFETMSFDAIPFMINETSGIISNILPIDREFKDLYAFQVLAIDDGALPTGSLTGTANITIHVLDVNNNAPKFPWGVREIHVTEDIALSQEFFMVTATDADIGSNGEISRYSLYNQNTASNDATKFELRTLANRSAILLTAGQFDRETKDRYDLILEAVDGGVPPLSTNLTLTIIIDDVNDNAPVFINTSHTVTIPRVTSVNTFIYTITAVDKDIGDNAIVTYTGRPADYFIVQVDTGVIRLNKSLNSSSENKLEIIVTASDGVHTSPNSFTLTVQISEMNTEPPRFGQPVYEFSLNESLPVNSLITILTASDPDSIVIYYFITAGNNERKFSIDPLSGSLTVAAQLNYELTRSYSLTIMAVDGSVDDIKSLNTTITVNINILDTNEEAPQFSSGSRVEVHVVENIVVKDFYKVQAVDPEGGAVTYEFADDSNGTFLLDEVSGSVSLGVFLDRELTPEISVKINAIDDGSPPRRSRLELIIKVDDENDNPPSFTVDSDSAVVSTQTIYDSNGEIYHALATDPDGGINGTVSYSLNNITWFNIQPMTGVVTLAPDTQPVGSFDLVVTGLDGGQPPLSATMTLRIVIEGSWDNITTTTRGPSVESTSMASQIPTDAVTNDDVSRTSSSYLSAISYLTDVSGLSSASLGSTNSITDVHGSSSEDNSTSSTTSRPSYATDISGVSVPSESSNSATTDANSHNTKEGGDMTPAISQEMSVSGHSAASASSTTANMHQSPFSATIGDHENVSTTANTTPNGSIPFVDTTAFVITIVSIIFALLLFVIALACCINTEQYN